VTDCAFALVCAASTASNSFVAFQDAAAAEALAARVGAQAGRACVVQGVPPLALMLLGREAGYGVEAVPSGAPWAPPEVLLDLARFEAGGGGGASDSLSASEASLRALLGSGDAAAEAAQRLAQRAAAAAVRRALLEPVSALRGAMTRAAGLPGGDASASADGDDDAKPLPAAASAMATALRAIARRRLEALLPRTSSSDDGAPSS
jgi:hypothetical protein